MTLRLPYIYIVVLISMCMLPLLAAAQTAPATTPTASNASAPYQFARQGVFGCNLTGSYSMSVGAMSAVGGVYVPVNDAAVTLNTGYLVYKECVLRGIVDRERESALAANTKQVVNATQTGRDGNPIFVSRFSKEKQDFKTENMLFGLQNRMSDLPDSLRGPLTQTLARSYMAETAGRTPTCKYPGNVKDLHQGKSTDPDYYAALRSSLDPDCTPVLAALARQEELNAYVARQEYEWEKKLDWGEGFYSIETRDAENNRIVLTPGTLNTGIVQQAVTSGWRQTENANDIDQMIGALFAGMGTHILSSAQGLQGLMQRIGTQPSYLDQVAAESAAGLRNSAANAAIQILSGALQVERAYNQIVSSIATTLTGTIQQLRTTENQCWALIISKVCATALAADNTCQHQPACTQGTDPTTGQPAQICPPTITLKVATTTTFSQQVIQSQITPLANQTVANIDNSNKALELINRLVSGVTNTTSIDAQRVALIQLDQLVAQGALHNQTQLSTVQQQQAAIRDAMTTLFNDTKTAWGDSTDPNVGWCNVNNPSVLQMWVQRWTQ